MPSKYIFLTVIVCLAVAFLVLAAIRVWRSRSVSQGIMLAAPLSELALQPVTTFDRVQYVSTTLTDDPLNRIHAHGMAFRGWADLAIGPQGILLKRKGERAIAIRSDSILKVGTAQATIDRGVEAGGLVQIDWKHDSHDLSTFLRAKSGSQKNQILSALGANIPKEEIN
ncbi:MAG: hypothetical protein ACKORF_07010 [Micrococcales bacterium]